MSARPSIVRLAPALLLAFAAGACSSAGKLTADRPACNSDSDCGGGDQICFEDGCGSAVDVAAVVNPNNNTLTVQDFNPVDVRKSRMDLTLKSPALIEGRLQIATKDTRTDYLEGFTLTARGRSTNIPGVEFPPVKQVFTRGAAFSIAVPPGLWDITATPADKKIPPAFAQRPVQRLTHLDKECGCEKVDPIDPQLVLSGEAMQIDGHVVKTTAIPWRGEQTFRLNALDPTSGIALSQPQLSMTSVSDPTPAFTLFVLKSSDALIVRVSPDGKTPAPTKDFRTDATGKLPDPLQLGDFGEPSDALVRVVDAEGMPLVDATVRVEGLVPGGGTYATDATAVPSRPGEYTARLLVPSEATQTVHYKITARPPPESRFATSELNDFEVVGGAKGALSLGPVKCPRKLGIKGLVTDVNHRPVDGVAVTVEGNPASPEPGITIGETVTDAQGNFSLLVERGSYRVIVKPPFERKLPWTSRRVTVTESTKMPTIALSDPRVVEGTLDVKASDGSSTGIPNARLEIFRASRGAGTGTSSIKLYDAVSDSAGHFRVILPKAGSDGSE